MAARDRKLSPPLRINQRFISFFFLSLSLLPSSLSFSLFIIIFFCCPSSLCLCLFLSYLFPPFQIGYKGKKKEKPRSYPHLYAIYTSSRWYLETINKAPRFQKESDNEEENKNIKNNEKQRKRSLKQQQQKKATNKRLTRCVQNDRFADGRCRGRPRCHLPAANATTADYFFSSTYMSVWIYICIYIYINVCIFLCNIETGIALIV